MPGCVCGRCGIEPFVDMEMLELINPNDILGFNNFRNDITDEANEDDEADDGEDIVFADNADDDTIVKDDMIVKVHNDRTIRMIDMQP